MADVFRLLRFALQWGLVVSGGTAAISAVGRALCLPPYWRRELIFRCRPSWATAFLHAAADTFLTTMLVLPAAMGIGGITFLLMRGVDALDHPSAARIAGAATGAVLWCLVAVRLEPGYLDFILGGYAIALGGLAGGLYAWRFGSPGSIAPERS